MHLKLAQIAGIVRYEFRLHWRGRALLVITLALLVMNGITALVMSQSSDAMPDGLVLNHSAMSWATVGVTLAFLLPVVIADTIPKDRQLAVRELLDTLPMTQGAYLLGKLLGVYLAVLSGLAVVMVVTGGIDLALFGEVNLPSFAEIWLVGVVSMTILSGGLGVLLPATQPNRRRAVVLVIVVLVLTTLIGGRSFQAGTIESYLNPIHPPIIMYYLTGAAGTFGGAAVSEFTRGDVWLSIGAGLVEVVMVGVAVWMWSRWRENRV
ncbi:MAG: ABC-2 transporter permease [Anaerolineaceae bacterium]|nr:ABC-2 transporter permease [Anaerolineaceae bacterium]